MDRKTKSYESEDGSPRRGNDPSNSAEDQALVNLITQTAKKSSYNNSKKDLSQKAEAPPPPPPKRSGCCGGVSDVAKPQAQEDEEKDAGASKHENSEPLKDVKFKDERRDDIKRESEETLLESQADEEAETRSSYLVNKPDLKEQTFGKTESKESCRKHESSSSTADSQLQDHVKLTKVQRFFNCDNKDGPKYDNIVRIRLKPKEDSGQE